jgi:hypothetical protein
MADRARVRRAAATCMHGEGGMAAAARRADGPRGFANVRAQGRRERGGQLGVDELHLDGLTSDDGERRGADARRTAGENFGTMNDDGDARWRRW